MYGADPRLADWGSKSGCRRLFAEEGVRHPLGHENLHTLEDVTAALLAMRAREPAMRGAIVKLNEGVSGAGNAFVDLAGLAPAGSAAEAGEVRATGAGDAAGEPRRAARRRTSRSSPSAAASSSST